MQSVYVWEQNLFCEEALDELDRHDSRRTAVAREHNYCFDWKILVGTPILLVLVLVLVLGKFNYYSKRLQNVVKVTKSNVLIDSILSIQIITSKPIL